MGKRRDNPAHGRGRRALCLLMCVLLALAPARVIAEQAEDDFRYGLINVLFNSDDPALTALRVLYDATGDVLYLNPRELADHLNDFTLHDRSGGCVVSVARRDFAFAADSAVVTMTLGETDYRVRLGAPMLYRDENYWIPADDLLYLANIDALPLVPEVEDNPWDPTQCLALICEPDWTVPELLYHIFASDGGAHWMFNYSDDLGLSAEDIRMKVSTAAAATGVHALMTVDLSAILQLCSENVTGLLNGLSKAKSKLFGTEAQTFASSYEKAYFKRFIEAMVAPTAAQNAALSEEWQDICAAIGQVGDYFTLAPKTVAAAADAAELVEAGTKQKWLEKALQSVATKLADKFVGGDTAILKAASEKIEKVTGPLGTILEVLQFGIATGHAIDVLDHRDALALDAIQVFLSASEDNYGMDDVARVSFEQSYETVRDSLKGMTSELSGKALDIFGLHAAELVAKDAAKSASLVGEFYKEFWSIVENARKDFIPSMDALESVQMSLYGIWYEVDALRALKDDYEGQVWPDGLSDKAKLNHCGMLALNYLNACLVTTECALVVYEHDSHVNGTQAYVRLKTKASQLALYVNRLSDALQALADGDTHGGLGVPLRAGGDIALDPPDCELLPLVQFTAQIVFSYDPFTAHAGQVTMYMLEGQHLLCDAGRDMMAWAALTDGETGFRPAPLSGGISTRLWVARLKDGRVLAEWDVATASNASARSRYTVYEAVSGQGFREALSGVSEVSGSGQQAKLRACSLNGTSCDAAALETAFAECGIGFTGASIAVGVGAKAAGQLTFFSAEVQNARTLLELSSAEVTALPPLFETLLDQYGVAE